MSRNTKIVLSILGGLIVVCLCVAVIGAFALRQAGNTLRESIVTDPTQAVQVAADIAQFDVPTGYELSAVRILGFDMAILESDDPTNEKTVLMLMQFPSGANLSQEEMNRQLQQAVEQQTNRRGLDLEPVGTETYTIRGDEVEMTVSEGTDEQGIQIRQMTGAFDGNQGTAILLVMAPVEFWDSAGIDAFIQSIR